MTTRNPKYHVATPNVVDSTSEPMEIEEWESSTDEEDKFTIEKKAPPNPIYIKTPDVVRNPRTGRYISTSSRAYNELRRGVYRTPTEKRAVTPPHEKEEKEDDAVDIWSRHGF